jgi:hypothetical protein
MDPNENIREQRRIATELIDGGEHTSEVWIEKAVRLAELVHALDTWILLGGFLPDGWQIAQKRANA